jgi:peptidoglycan biosynthesis protein MviN/MurJ (putative lipid II flippase)
MSLAFAAPWIALAFGIGAAAFCAAALNARSLMIAILALFAAGAMAASGLLALGYGDAALALALSGAGFTPVLVLAGLLLSARTVKPRRTRKPYVIAVSALALAGVLLWGLLQAGAPVVPLGAPEHHGSSVLGLAPLFLTLAVACLALLGFGERGAFDHPPAPSGEREP